MYLDRLAVNGLRNLESVDVRLAPGANFIYGANGSGKTSLLEAVYLLGRGRSFRHRNLKTVINHDQIECTVFGSLLTEQGGRSTIGVKRNRGGELTIKVDGEHVKAASVLAQLFPVQLLNSDSFLLLEGAPAYRRSFLDWGVFHVEHSFRSLWVRLQRCLKHRNSLLRHGRIDRLQLSVWDRELIPLANQVTEQRVAYLEALQPVLESIVDKLGLPTGWSFEYYRGWDSETPYETQLDLQLARDQKAGFTQLGPHRADIRIRLNGRMAAEVLSRGQTKVLVTALKLAQGYHYKQLTEKECVFLLDDLPAELDQQYRLRVGTLLQELGVQVLVTGVEKSEMLHSWPPCEGVDGRSQVKLFHVKHGLVIEEDG